MAKKLKPGYREVSGILLLNKPAGMSSNDALQKVKRIFAAAKAGHTGSLDPLATGVLPVCLGEATKFSGYLLDADKVYRSTFSLGRSTTTGDREGEIVNELCAQHVVEKNIHDAAGKLLGEIEQIPPMYSALKLDGQPLYKLARKGQIVERTPRKVVIRRLDIINFRPGKFPEVDVEVHCSKGTYIRTLAEDMGLLLGTCAHVSHLHRVGVGRFGIEGTVTLDQLRNERGEGAAEILDHHLLPVQDAIDHMKQVVLPVATGFYFQRGQAVQILAVMQQTVPGELARVSTETGEFLGVAVIKEDGMVAPKRLVNTASIHQ